MKRIVVMLMLFMAAVAESSAQERIDALLQRELYSKSGNRVVKLRSAVKRDPESGEIIKRVTELHCRDDKTLMREFVEAFGVESANADTYEISEIDSKRGRYMLVWQNPLRIYNLSYGNGLFKVTTQIVYRPQQNENINDKNE